MVGFEPTCPVRDKTISSRSRYDHFDTSPYSVQKNFRKCCLLDSVYIAYGKKCRREIFLFLGAMKCRVLFCKCLAHSTVWLYKVLCRLSNKNRLPLKNAKFTKRGKRPLFYFAILHLLRCLCFFNSVCSWQIIY